MNEGMRNNMNQIEQYIIDLAAEDLPDFNKVVRSGRDCATQIKLGTSAFLKKYDCGSEQEYKRQCMNEGRIMYHAHIGMNDMPATARALQQIYTHLDAQGFRMDRAGFAVDRRMGLPRELQSSVAAETGPMLTTAEDWSLLAQAAPIQPHLGDFMIGQPASLANTVNALRTGCTTIGNLSQFFSFEAPGWKDRLATSVETVKAIAVLGWFRERGMMLHSYLEDGYGALFKHCSTVAAWAMLEHYIVEELLGAKLSHCIGGLTSDPIKRAGWVLALQRIHKGEQVGSMIYGDTISFGSDFDKNRAVTAEYLLWDILVQMHCPSGHAVLPLPVTEAIRIPSGEEILEAQCFGRQVEKTATRLYPHVDFSAAQTFADSVCEDGSRIYENAMQGLKQCGVDCRNPLQMLYVLKNLGAQNFETLFADDVTAGSSIQTDMFLLSQSVLDDYRPLFESAEMRLKMQGKQFLLASSDVHEHAIGALAQLLGEAGAEVINLGAEQTPQDLVNQLIRQSADAVLLSTHNGMALEYARELKSAMESNQIALPVVLGGVLNQKVDDAPLPVPVIEDLKQLGFHPATSLPHLTKLLEVKSHKGG
jgi:methylmalonyl-CoA mutase cobalamin-binding subunit